MPEATRFADALGSIPFVVGIGTIMNETLGHADLVLPSTHPFEEWGDYVPDPAPRQHVVGFQQPVVTPSISGRSFGDILLTLWHDLRPNLAPPWETMRDAVRDSAAQVFRGGEFEERWIELLKNGGGWSNEISPDFAGTLEWHVNLLAEPAFSDNGVEFPLHLIPFEGVALGGGDETANPWLQATPDPLSTATWTTWVEMNPSTAAALDVSRGDVVRIRNRPRSIRGDGLHFTGRRARRTGPCRSVRGTLSAAAGARNAAQTCWPAWLR